MNVRLQMIMCLYKIYAGLRNENFRKSLHADGEGISTEHNQALLESTYFRRQHGHMCFDADDRVARFSRQSSQRARHLYKNGGSHQQTLTNRRDAEDTHRQGQQIICRGSTVQTTQFCLASVKPSFSRIGPTIDTRSSMIFDQSSNTLSRSNGRESARPISREYRRRVSGEFVVSVI